MILQNFIWFLLKLFQYRKLDGGPKVSKKEASKRYNICLQCSKLNNKGFLVKLKGPRCSLCGCFLKLKTQFKVEECPDTPPKWKDEINNKKEKKKKILFLLKQRIYNENYATSYGLINSSKQIALFLEKNNYDCKVITVADGNAIDKELYKYKPDIVVLEALWCPSYKLKELIELQRYKNIKWIVRIHSDSGFLSAESNALKYVNEYLELNKNNLFISFNNKEFAGEINKILNENIIYLPNIIKLDNHFKKKKNKNEIHIGCFGALRILKNQLFQGICAINAANKLNKKLFFHINTAVTDNTNPVLNNLREIFKNTEHNLIIHKWLEHEKFEKLIQKMDLGLQLSYTESFNIVAADFVNNGIPIIVSEAINWVPKIYFTSTVNYKNVIKKIVQLYKLKNNFLIILLAKYKLKKLIKKSENIWLNYLETL